jgi:hypothetical protein
MYVLVCANKILYTFCGACWNSALPVISIVYKLQEKAIQVVLPLGTTCAGMPSIPINTTQDRLLCPYIASILARNERQQVYHRDDPKELASQLPAKVNSIFIYNELTYLTT